MKTCKCSAWKTNIDLLNMCLILMQARGDNEGLSKAFSHCPWCASVLIEYDNDDKKVPWFRKIFKGSK